MDFANQLIDSMTRYLGQTVTIFTTSGGISGGGFTGVLISADCHVVRLLCDMGSAPSCPVGSACTGPMNGQGAYGYNGYLNPLGAICDIPTCAIACFTHNAI